MRSREAGGPRIMMYSQDGFGLGHMRRVNSIARRLLVNCPDARVVTVGDSPLAHGFAMAPNQRHVRLPSVVRDGFGTWRPVSHGQTFEQVHAIRTKVIRDAVFRFRPTVLLVDHMAAGVRGDLVPALDALHASGAATRVVLGLRDIVDGPERVRRRWQAEGECDTIERFYDSVLVYGEREVFDLASQYLLPPSIAGRLRYCGYVCAPELPQTRARDCVTRLSGKARGAKLIAVMAGGGADSYPVMRACLGALPAIRGHHDTDMVLHTGPFMPPGLRLELQHLAGALGGVRVSGGVSDTLSSLQEADLVVGMCGYNTTVEVLRSGRPSILIPRAGPSMEQSIRAGLFAERGWVQTLDPELMDVEALAELVVTSLWRAPMPRCPVPRMRGLAAAADDLLSSVIREPGTPGVKRP